MTSVDRFILCAIEIDLGFHRRLQGMNEEKSQTIFFFECRASQQTQRIKNRDVRLAPEDTRDKINEKRESTLLYLAVISITTNNALLDLSRYSPRIRKLAQM